MGHQSMMKAWRCLFNWVVDNEQLLAALNDHACGREVVIQDAWETHVDCTTENDECAEILKGIFSEVDYRCIVEKLFGGGYFDDPTSDLEYGYGE